MSHQILRLPAVIVRTGLSRSTIYQRIAEGEFPSPIKLGSKHSRAVGWLESTIDAWMSARIEQSRTNR